MPKILLSLSLLGLGKRVTNGVHTIFSCVIELYLASHKSEKIYILETLPLLNRTYYVDSLTDIG